MGTLAHHATFVKLLKLHQLTGVEEHFLHPVDADGQLVRVFLRPWEGHVSSRAVLDDHCLARRLLGEPRLANNPDRPDCP